MADRKYAVAFGGEFSEGVTPTRLRERLSKLREPLTEQQIDALLATRNATLKLFADRDSANHFVAELRDAGVACWLRLLHPGEQVSELLDPQRRVDATPEPPPSVASAIAAPRKPMLGPGAMTALIALGVAGSIIAWYAWPQSSRHHRMIAAADSRTVADAETTPQPAAVAPVTEAGAPPDAKPVENTSNALMVPEPTWTVSAKRESAKPAAAAQAATLEAPKTEDAAAAQPIKTSLQPGLGVATFAPSAGTSVAQPAVPASAKPSAPIQLAMSAPVAPKADRVVPPSYDPGRVAQPKYPVQSFRNGEQGVVLLNVLVGTDGSPKRVSVDRTSGFVLLDRAALETVKRWQFTPGSRNGVPQEAARQVAVGFKLGEQ